MQEDPKRTLSALLLAMEPVGQNKVGDIRRS